MDLGPVEPASAAIEVRLSKAQIAVIWPGLNYIVGAYMVRESGGQTGTSYLFQLQPLPPGFDSGTFSQSMMNRLGWLCVKLEAMRVTGGRVRLDAFELRGAAFSARTSIKVERIKIRGARKRGAESKRIPVSAGRPVRRISRDKKAVIKYLENCMKRAVRQFRKTAGSRQYKESSKEWQSHLQWVKYRLAYFKPYRRPGLGARGLQILCVNELVKMAEDAIRIRGYKMPAAESLRHVIRQFIAYSRRGRIGQYNHVYMLRKSKSPLAKATLFEFIEPRLYLEKS